MKAIVSPFSPLSEAVINAESDTERGPSQPSILRGTGDQNVTYGRVALKTQDGPLVHQA
jgi:hypothetical protein